MLSGPSSAGNQATPCVDTYANADDETLPSQKWILNLVKRMGLTGTRKVPDQEPVHYYSFLCGLLAGVAQAAMFNPYDRALYLSIKEKRAFLLYTNWSSPYNGFLQSIGGRAISGGLYFPVEHMFLHALLDCDNKAMRNFIAGTSAGAVNAILLNPLTAVKYKTWGRDVNRGMWNEARRMLEKGGGLRPFLNGITPTICRDVVFGGCYTWLRLQIQVWFDLSLQDQWKANMMAATMATIVSGPFNYARNMQYSTPVRKEAPSISVVLKELIVETMQQSTRIQQIMFVTHRLRIGWGTARVALGMAFGHSVYDWLVAQIHGRNVPS